MEVFSTLSRSRALNTIPQRKAQEKILSVVSACEVCSKLGLKADSSIDGLCSKCSIIITAINRYVESNIPVEYWGLKMEKHFQGDPRLLAKYNEIVSDLQKTFVSGSSICFAGIHGIGKTMCSACILKKAAQKGFTCLYADVANIVSVLTQAPPEEQFAARRELVMVDFLVIDELDNRFFATENAGNLYARTLEIIFRTRSQNKLPTFLCTNSPNIVETFSGAMKQSLDSLMAGYVDTFVVLGQDFRKKAKVE